MKVRLLIILLVFGLVGGGIMGFRYYVTSDLPQGDPDARPDAESVEGEFAAPDIGGGQAVAPGA